MTVVDGRVFLYPKPGVQPMSAARVAMSQPDRWRKQALVAIGAHACDSCRLLTGEALCGETGFCCGFWTPNWCPQKSLFFHSLKEQKVGKTSEI